MLKKASLRKIAVTTSALLVLLMLYIFPVSNKTEISSSVVYVPDTNANVYLPDKSNFISLVPVKINEKDTIKNVKKRIYYLQNDSDYTKNFRKVIPKNTRLLNVNLSNNILTLDFDSKLKESKNINEMITSIVYSVTELKEIKSVKILVNNNYLENYDYQLDRSIGINKISDFDSLNNLESTTIYYINKEENNLYYTPVTKITNKSIEKIEVIVTELKSSPILQTNLASYLSNNAELSSYKQEKNVMNLYFNDKTSSIFATDKVIEEVKYCITKSVLDNYEVEVVNIYFNDKKI